MVFGYTFDELRKIVTEEELDNLAKTLNKFLEVYFKNIYIGTEKEIDAFEKIKRIQFLLVTKQYAELFDNPNAVIQTYREMDQYD